MDGWKPMVLIGESSVLYHKYIPLRTQTEASIP